MSLRRARAPKPLAGGLREGRPSISGAILKPSRSCDVDSTFACTDPNCTRRKLCSRIALAKRRMLGHDRKKAKGRRLAWGADYNAASTTSPSFTASQIPIRRPADWNGAARASGQSLGKRDYQSSTHCCDRVRDFPHRSTDRHGQIVPIAGDKSRCDRVKCLVGSAAVRHGQSPLAQLER
jgi:hypothetical protein